MLALGPSGLLGLALVAAGVLLFFSPAPLRLPLATLTPVKPVSTPAPSRPNLRPPPRWGTLPGPMSSLRRVRQGTAAPPQDPRPTAPLALRPVVVTAFLAAAAAGLARLLRPPRPPVALCAGTAEQAPPEAKPEETNFIFKIIQEDIETGTYGGRVATRFPPEPNGHLHIGHAKSICLNFRVAQKFGGTCNLRFDDTNPEKEDEDFVHSIMEDVQWLGYQWDGPVRYASDYFPKLYGFATQLIREGRAFVCSLSFEQAREYRGTLTSPGRNSPDRDRPVEENLRLFEEMRAGQHPEGSLTLRLKIDMASPIISMRDPVIYRIKFATHHQTGDEWCIYPMYDFTHCLSDALEGITHSLCTLEFEGNRPLYEWVLQALHFDQPPKQREFARLNMSHWIMSKRLLTQLVSEGLVSGWDDPRLPTLKGLRRRGYTATAVRAFIDSLAIGKSDSTISIEQLEAAARAELEWDAARRMVVLEPLKVTLVTYEGGPLELEQPNHPSVEAMGSRVVPFGQVVYIDRSDFSDNPPKGYKRLTATNAVRLRGSYVIRLKEVLYDAAGEIAELLCEHDPDTLGQNPVGYKAKGVIHWVSAEASLECQVNLYGKLFSAERPGVGDLHGELNPDSLQVVPAARMEAALGYAVPGERFQFERQGYFVLDSKAGGKPVFNRICSLKEGW